MKINLDRVRDEPLHWQETQTVDPASLGQPELVGLSEIDWRGRVSFAESGYFFTAHLAYEQTLVCTRCLGSYLEAVEADVDLLLRVETGAEVPGASGREGEGSDAGGEMELSGEDMGVVMLLSERFDTEPILLEQLLLNVPMKPLCRVDCRGLCPVCGIDRNRERCSCVEEPIDPRWEALADLKDRLEEKP